MLRALLLGLGWGAIAAAQPTIGAVVNAGSGDGRLSPGILATIIGNGFSPGTIGVTVYGLPAPVVGPTNNSQITVQFPFSLPQGSFGVIVSVNGKASAPFTVSIASFAPSYVIFGGALFSDGNFNPFTAARPANPGKQAAAYLVGLGATNPAVPEGQSTNSPAPTLATPTLIVGGKAANILYCGMAPGIVGTYQVTFIVPPDIPAGSQDVLFSIAGVAAPKVSLPTSSGTAVIGSVANGATFQVKDATHGAAPNSFISIFASNLPAGDTQNNVFPATSYQGVSVLFNGRAAPLYFVFGSLNQINLVTPSELPENGTVSVTVQTSAGPSTTSLLTMAPADVGIFPLTDPGNAKRRNGAVLIANTAWRVMPASMAKALILPACTGLAAVAVCGQPASVGDAIQIYFTGGGKATPGGDAAKPPLAAGSVAPADGSVIYQTVQQPALTIGGIGAQVLFSGIAPGNAGLYQVNTVIPAGVQPGDDVPIVLSMGATSDTATIAVK